MKNHLRLIVYTVLIGGLTTGNSWARGGGGARGGGRAAGGGGTRSAAAHTPSMSRAAPKPSSRPQPTPPSTSRPSPSQRPSTSRPSTGQRPADSRPSGTRPENRPNVGQPGGQRRDADNRPQPGATRPAAGRPDIPGASDRMAINRPGTGSQRPTNQRPSKEDLGNFLDLPGTDQPAPRPATRDNRITGNRVTGDRTEIDNRVNQLNRDRTNVGDVNINVGNKVAVNRENNINSIRNKWTNVENRPFDRNWWSGRDAIRNNPAWRWQSHWDRYPNNWCWRPVPGRPLVAGSPGRGRSRIPTTMAAPLFIETTMFTSTTSNMRRRTSTTNKRRRSRPASLPT